MMSLRKSITFAIIPIALAFFPPEHYRKLYNDDFPEHNQDSNTLDGIHQSRDNAESAESDVETPMQYRSETRPEELKDNQLHDPYAYPLHSTEGTEGTDEYPSESQSKSSFLSDGCLRCLCEASSDCDPQVQCHVKGQVGYCGAFQINSNYWKEAGSPGSEQNDPLDYDDCMNNIDCSIETVNSYMKKWAKDCDGDGRISCDDYAKIHKAGAYQCNSSRILDTPFWNKYRNCYFEYK